MLLTHLRWDPASGGTLWFDDASRPCPSAEIDALDARLHATLGNTWKPPAAADVGRGLWDWLQGDGQRLGAVAAGLAAGRGWRLEIADPRGVLTHLPWELLHDGNGHLAQRMPWFVPVRRVDVGVGELPHDDPPRHDLGVLFMAAAPPGERVLAYEAEEARILDASRGDDIFLTVEESGTLDGLGLRLTDLEGRWDVVHLTCHGHHAPPRLALESDEGTLDAVEPGRLQAALGACAPGLLALSACLTAVRAEATPDSYASAMARAGVGAVLGFASKVDDEKATVFVATLYGHLGRAESLGEALARTRFEALNADPLAADDRAKANHPAVWGAARLFLSRAVERLAAPAQVRAARKLTRRADPGAFLRASGKTLKTAAPARFVGRRRALQKLVACLRGGDAVGAFVQGLGGAGKSSLVARALSRVALKPVVVYQQIDRAGVLRALREAWEDDATVTALLSPEAVQRAREERVPDGFRALLRQVLATAALRERPMALVLDDAEARMEAQEGGHAFDAEARVTLRGVLGAWEATTGCASRVVITGRYGFTLVDDDSGRDLLARVEPFNLLRMDAVEARKLLRQADRYDDDGRPRERTARRGDAALRGRLLAVGAINPRLLALLHRLLVADEARGAAAVAQMEAWLDREENARIDEEELVDFLDDLVIDDLLELAGDEGRLLVAALAGLEVAVPQDAVCAAAGLGADVVERGVALGLVERDEEGLVAVVPLVAARCEALGEVARKEFMRALLASLPASWRGTGEGEWEGPAERARFLFRWAADVEPPDSALGAAVAERHLWKLREGSEAALLREETVRWERLGLRWQGADALVWAWGTVDSERAAALLEAALVALPRSADSGQRAVLLICRADGLRRAGDTRAAEEALNEAGNMTATGDHRLRAVVAGRRADALEAQGELDAALRIRLEDELPTHKNMGDTREYAITLGKIASILEARGDLDSALHIYRQEVLPVFEQIGDTRERVAILGRIADIQEKRWELDEVMQARRQEVDIYEHLGDTLSYAIAQRKVADVLQMRGDLEGALRLLLDKSLPAAWKAGSIRDATVFQGRVADILQLQGNTDEALRIRWEIELPVYKAMKDAHATAITLDKIADIVELTGKTDYAQKIRKESVLPIFAQIGDICSRTAVITKLAATEMARGQFKAAQDLLEADILPAYVHLKNPVGIGIVRWRLGQIFMRQHRIDDALVSIETAFRCFLQHNYAQGIVAVGQDYLALLQHTGATDRIPAVRAAIAPFARRLGRA